MLVAAADLVTDDAVDDESTVPGVRTLPVNGYATSTVT